MSSPPTDVNGLLDSISYQESNKASKIQVARNSITVRQRKGVDIQNSMEKCYQHWCSTVPLMERSENGLIHTEDMDYLVTRLSLHKYLSYTKTREKKDNKGNFIPNTRLGYVVSLSCCLLSE
jgi:hypothetical protein